MQEAWCLFPISITLAQKNFSPSAFFLVFSWLSGALLPRSSLFMIFLDVSFSELIVQSVVLYCDASLSTFHPSAPTTIYFLLLRFLSGIFKTQIAPVIHFTQHSPHTVKLVHLRRWQNGMKIGTKKQALGKGATTNRSALQITLKPYISLKHFFRAVIGARN